MKNYKNNSEVLFQLQGIKGRAAPRLSDQNTSCGAFASYTTIDGTPIKTIGGEDPNRKEFLWDSGALIPHRPAA